MGFLNKAKEGLNIKDSLSKVTVIISDAAKSGMEKISRSNTKEVSEEEMLEKGSKMLKVMDWAFDKATGDIPGLGSSSDMAKKYLDKYGSVNAAVDHLVKWQITSSATTGFATSFGGLPTMAITLPANIAGVMGIQLRMIGAIAELGGFHEQTEEKKTGMYLCLLGSQAGNGTIRHKIFHRCFEKAARLGTDQNQPSCRVSAFHKIRSKRACQHSQSNPRGGRRGGRLH